MKLIVVSEFDAILMIEGENFVLDANTQSVEIEFEEKFEVSGFVYSQNNKCLPYGFLVKKTNEDFKCESKHVQLYQVSDNTFQMRLKKFKLNQLGFEKTYKKEIGDFSLMLFQAQTSLFVVKEKERINFFETQKELEELAFDLIKNVPFFVANVKKDKFICVFCPFNQKFYAFNAIKVKIDEDKIEIIENLFSHAGHGRKIVLTVKDNNEIVLNEELLYLNQKPEIASNLKVVPFAFFESVRLKDYDLAKTYLSSTLKNALNEEILKEYFGDFVKVVPNNYSLKNGFFVSVLTKSYCKVFAFKFEGGKINDINLIKEYAIK